ncbi:MAG TPA: GspE/PulE family protein [bacterium]|nr:GspE/PulE family protein [bacterium]
MYTLEDILVSAGLVTPDQMLIAKESQKNLGDPLEQVLIERGFINETLLLKTIAKHMNTSYVSLGRYKLDPQVLGLLPVDAIKKFKAIPLFKIENKVTVAMSNPADLDALDSIRMLLKCDVEPFFALDHDIERVIKEQFRGQGITLKEIETKIQLMTTEDEVVPNTQTEKLAKEASGEAVVNAVNNILLQALEDGASDIHLEPSRRGLLVRLRLDGLLEEFTTLPKNIHLPVISRVKIMSHIDVAESRLPQDGRFRFRVGETETDVRVATYPTMFGEAAAIRLLSKGQLITLEQLGFQPEDMLKFAGLIAKPHGILLVTGPTGSGKTTSLYASLLRINSKDKHILSIEDPVEHEIEGIDQQQVNVKAGMTFAAALRAMLRQDPDVIMVGEIRDLETADIAMRAAMTGHLVLSTLHTNTAVGAISRLMDLGIEPYLVSSSLIGVLAQRLVRRICHHCKEGTVIPQDQLKRLGKNIAIEKAFKGAGCKFCRNTGYSGRVGLFEIVVVTEEIKNLIVAKAPEALLMEKLLELGHKTIIHDGLKKANQGLTTVEEILRVTASI